MLQGYSKFPWGIKELGIFRVTQHTMNVGDGKDIKTYIKCERCKATVRWRQQAGTLQDEFDHYWCFVGQLLNTILMLVQFSRCTFRWIVQGYSKYSQGIEEVERAQGTFTSANICAKQGWCFLGQPYHPPTLCLCWLNYQGIHWGDWCKVAVTFLRALKS